MERSSTVITPEADTDAPGVARAPATVGSFFAGFTPFVDDETVFGAKIAVQGFYRSLMRHGSLCAYEFYCSTLGEPLVNAQVNELRDPSDPSRPPLHVFNRNLLFNDSPLPQFKVWYDPGSDVRRPFHLRRLRPRNPFAVAITHHTISYQSMLHEWFLPLLLAETQPFDSVICTSRDARRAIENLMNHVKERFNAAYGTRLDYKGRLDVLPIGVDTDLFRPRDKADVRYQLGIPQDALVILWFGRFSYADKMDLVPSIRIFERLANKYPDRNLLYLLAGSEKPGVAADVRRQAELLKLGNRLKVLLNFPVHRRHLLFSAADIFVSPVDNIQETFGITPIEAMASGVPQVVSDWDGYKDTVRHEETGFLVPTYWIRSEEDLRETAEMLLWEHDHQALAQSVVPDPDLFRISLERLIENEALRGEMGERSRRRAVATYGWPAVIRQYETLWEEMAAMASASDAPREARRRYTDPPYFDAFRHYASREIDEDAEIAITQGGRKVVYGWERMPTTVTVPSTLNAELLERALVKLSGRSRSPLGRLATELSQEMSLHRHLILRHLMWLLKYQLIAFSDKKDPRSPSS